MPLSRSHSLRVVLRSLHLVQGLAIASTVAVFEGVRRSRQGRSGWLGAAGHALVRLCTHLGATFIKMGQIASTRSDLLPGPIAEELSTLQDRVAPFPFDQVRITIERDLGHPLTEIFESFDPVPVAAASVAQVHRARLRRGGHDVAVKVRRPDIIERAALDRSILLFLARNLERAVPTLRLISLEDAIRTFCDAIEEQLHLSNEARHNRRFAENFAAEPDVLFPPLHPAASSDSVLTMDFIDGVHESELATRGVDVVRVVEAGMRVVCRMIFLHGFVHADLHPGNIRFLPPGRLVLLDLGLVGELDDVDRITTAKLLFAFATGDGKTVARLFFDNAPHTATPDYSRYEREIVSFVESVKSKGLANLQVTLEIGRIFDILRRHRVQARAHMTMVNLALMTAEGLGKRLAPDLSLTDAALPYLAEALGVAVPPPEATEAAEAG